MDNGWDKELDKRLKQLAIKAQQHPMMTPERQRALVQLVQAILQSGRLCRPYWGQFEGIYEDIYNEARQDMLLYICQKIDDYDPEKSPVMRWVNFLLEKRFFREAIPKFMDKNIIRRTLDDLENIIQPEEEFSTSEMVSECIEEDREDIFKNEYIENNPQANFQFLAKKRLAGATWKEISEELCIKVATLSSFYQRCLKKFAVKLREYCQNHGS
ncbi:sigma-70 family RNA polymerase sigma factor [Argonema antarcticum]|uniref:sigma-70 family RNA polymerase sigma factor n=1 Tax=Argonema antarcticum TaxID=2942763 RepID=UPI0020112058|nr:sigma-70 family RNA polymerase sigma factor [Argonema antarcticum]MCL1474991.1 sigma-70 family RNA polymerase sigma factor [Argonema antarcticum A004/B2]